MIYIAAPCYNGMSVHTSKALLQCGRSKYDVVIQEQDYSILCYNFNVMWCDMLNKRRSGEDVRYFCMIHSDVNIVDDLIEGNWLDVFVDLLEEREVDVLSVVSPLKDNRGVTSTGIYDVEKEVIVKRLTMTEVKKLPQTFGMYDIWEKIDIDIGSVKGKEKNKLVVNTGLMLVKVDDWCEKVFFHDKHYVLKVTDTETGVVTFIAQVVSEDWMFSVDVQKLGMKVEATTKLAIEHIGKCGYGNYGAWGTLKVDDLSK